MAASHLMCSFSLFRPGALATSAKLNALSVMEIDDAHLPSWLRQMLRLQVIESENRHRWCKAEFVGARIW